MKSWASICLVLYVLINQNGQVIKATYQGMSKQTVAALISERKGATYRFVDKATFDAVPNNTKPLIDHSAAQDARRAIATDKKKSDTERLDALVDYLGLK